MKKKIKQQKKPSLIVRHGVFAGVIVCLFQLSRLILLPPVPQAAPPAPFRKSALSCGVSVRPDEPPKIQIVKQAGRLQQQQQHTHPTHIHTQHTQRHSGNTIQSQQKQR